MTVLKWRTANNRGVSLSTMTRLARSVVAVCLLDLVAVSSVPCRSTDTLHTGLVDQSGDQEAKICNFDGMTSQKGRKEISVMSHCTKEDVTAGMECLNRYCTGTWHTGSERSTYAGLACLRRFKLTNLVSTAKLPSKPPWFRGFDSPVVVALRKNKKIFRHDTRIDEMYHFFDMTSCDVISCLICPSNYATGGKPWGIIPNDPPPPGRLSSRLTKFVSLPRLRWTKMKFWKLVCAILTSGRSWSM